MVSVVNHYGVAMLQAYLGIAVFKGGFVSGLHQAHPYVERGSALLLIVAGSHIVYYWLFRGGLIDTFA